MAEGPRARRHVSKDRNFSEQHEQDGNTITARHKRIQQYCGRMRVESTFQDMKRRGWQWESSYVRHLDWVERLLLVLFLALWWLMHLAASCVHRGWRSRYDRHDRREKGMLRLGRLYFRDSERSGYDGCAGYM